MSKDSPKISHVMRKLSAYIVEASKKTLPPEVSERAKLHLLDTLAAMVSGSRLLPGKRAISYIKGLDGSRQAGVVGSRIVTTAVNAALVNGMCAHADETDDVHDEAFNHPGASVVPAALAVAERYRRGGADLLRAVALGYDIGARTTLALRPLPLFFRGHHPPSIGGIFGAASASGALARIDPERVRYMLSYTAQQAAGLSCLFSDPQHIEKAFDMGGMPAHNGVQAALFAAHGFTGVGDVFSGERNFFFTFGNGGKASEVVRDLGRRYEIMNGSIKKWPVGGPILAPLDAIVTLRSAQNFSADDVQRIVVTVAEEKAAVVNNRPSPDINIQHLVALMLIDGRVTFRSSHDFLRMRDPKIVRYKKRIELIGSRKMSGNKRLRNGHVKIILRDGRILEHYVHAARGTHLNPMSWEEEEEKARDLLVPVLGAKRALMLIDTVRSIDKMKDVTGLRKLYCR